MGAIHNVISIVENLVGIIISDLSIPILALLEILCTPHTGEISSGKEDGILPDNIVLDTNDTVLESTVAGDETCSS